MSQDPSLLEHLDGQQINCLNESTGHTIKSILSTKGANTSSSAYLLSDTDEQLLITIPFNQTVRIKAISFKTSSEHADRAPKKVKLIINRNSVGFEDVEDAEEPSVAQMLELTPAQTNGEKIALRFVRFQSVSSLHIFVASNQGDEDETRIDAIDVFGTPVETTRDLSGLRQPEQ